MTSRRRILAQDASTAPGQGWFARGALPGELLETAARRLGVLALLTAATFLCVSLFAGLVTPREAKGVGIGCSVCALVFSFIMYGFTRRHRERPRLLLDLAVPYQIAMAAVIGVADHLGPLFQRSYLRGWSGVAVWIFVFAVFVPSTPRRTLWVSSVVAVMDPLALLMGHVLRLPLPPAVALPHLYGPTALAVVTAVIASRINFGMGKKLHEAREMGSYELVELLGTGGMGEVWRAAHRMLARPAAIKLIRTDALGGGTAAGKEGILRFEREAQATALLQSEHTVELYDFGVATDGAFYYVMELLDGLDLEQLIRRHGPVPPERAVHLLLQVCDSLAEAHEGGLVHRDIKPSNIHVCKRALRYDAVKVLDFGLVKRTAVGPVGLGTVTDRGSISGTPAFMAPEVIEGAEPLDGRADLYALGCVAYWLLAGRLVFEGDTAMKMIVSHVKDEPAPLRELVGEQIPAALDELVLACLEKDRGRRPQSAQELAARLAALDLASAWTQERARRWWREVVVDRDGVDPLETTLPPI